MNPNVAPEPIKKKSNTPRLSRRAVAWLAGILLVIGAGAAYWHHINHPPQPWLVRWRLNRYLSKEANNGNFKVSFPFPSKEEMAKASPRGKTAEEPKGSRTGKTYDALRDEYLGLKTAAVRLENEVANEARRRRNRNTNAVQAAEAKRAELQTKTQALEPITDDLWELVHKMFPETDAASSGTAVALAKARDELRREIGQKASAAESYSQMYHLIGQELWVADQLLESKNDDHRRGGVDLALAASRNAIDQALNGGVAARICEGYILPNMDVATDTSQRSPFNADNLLRQCADIFTQNNEFANVARLYVDYLKRSTTPQRADWARYQIADAYEMGGDQKSALYYLKQMQNTNDIRLGRRIGRLERQLGTK